MPVERMRMRPWLEEQINQGMIQGLKWVNKEKKIFQIPWMHAARHGWDVEKDAPLFRNWAIHTGKYTPGVDKPDPKTWKANFRCAMNSLPDIEEVKDKSMKKGSNAFRVYKMLSETERPKKKGKKGKKRGEKEEKSKAERRVSSHAATNGGSSQGPAAPKVEDVADSTVLTEPPRPAVRSPLDDSLIISDLPDVCQTIEVMTENEEQSVSSSHPYPLQISPVSSYGESDTDSVEEDTKEGGSAWLPGRRQNKPMFSPSVLKMPSCPLPGMATFVTSGKPNFRVISSREESPLIAYDSTPWDPIFLSIQPPQVPDAASTHCPAPVPAGPAHEPRASVIMKTPDVSTSTVKTC
ncbi:interferon regulatory factor 2-like isoform X1 [Scleropages formosus]|uniref:interferon regulatory factor 2-like isoform X1 n=1 Tax=Scleropages formosus TaxID=113540 RepID=UPI000878D746|nr:interferon regulatory factor 2-like isoform X1 [Scleropages formosus]